MGLNRLQQLYRQVILNAAVSPVRWGDVGTAQPVHAVNPSCGDQLDLTLQLRDGKQLTGLAVATTGCTISQASANLMVCAVAGKTRTEALALIDDFITMIRDGSPATAQLGDAAALASVHEFPARVKCALLAWTTLRQALTVKGDSEFARNQEQ